jgi:hypothetical protein
MEDFFLSLVPKVLAKVVFKMITAILERIKAKKKSATDEVTD